MPWDTPLTRIRDSLTGPTAVALGLIGFFVFAAAMVFGGEMPDFARRLVMVAMIVSVMLAGTGFLGALGITGALVP